MAGKIFNESNNIYQDQARILFGYYRQAAEKIVSEEERIEKQPRCQRHKRLERECERERGGGCHRGFSCIPGRSAAASQMVNGGL